METKQSLWGLNVTLNNSSISMISYFIFLLTMLIYITLKFKKKKTIPAYHFCTPIFTCKKKKIKVKCLQYPPQKTKGWKIMLTVKSQQKMSETSLATSKSNQSYKMHNYILSIVAQYIIFIIIFHLLTLVQYLISMFHLNCLSAFSLLVQSIISRHQC